MCVLGWGGVGGGLLNASAVHVWRPVRASVVLIPIQ